MNVEYAEGLANFARLVDDKTGMIHSVEVMKISAWDPQVYMAHADPCDTVPLTGIRAANRGAACSTTAERAIIRACGESIERYCSSFFDVREMRLASEFQMANECLRCIRTHDVYPFAPWQYEQAGFPYKKLETTSNVRWVQGTSLTTDEEVWVPASCVYVPYLFDVAVEGFTHMPISTGLAAGPSVESCIRKGLFEILERDALMLVWYGEIPIPRIDPESCLGVSSQIDDLISVARNQSSWYLNWLTLDIDVPIISAALIDAGSPPLTSFGIAADEDPARALLLALEEAVLTRVLLNRCDEVITNPDYVHERVNTLRDHLLAHATSPALRENLRSITEAGPLLRFGDLMEIVDKRPQVQLCDRFTNAKFEPVVVEVTTPDIKDFGFRVVRSVIPGMQPLDNDHRYRYLGGRRLLDVPPSLGYPQRTMDQLNHNPHPFP